MDSSTAVVLAASLSGLCSAITAIGVTAVTKRSDERRHFREIVIRTAIENWKVADLAADQAGSERWPLDVFIVHMLKFSELFNKKRLTAEFVAKIHRETDLLVEEAMRLALEATKIRNQDEKKEL
jgi:hypothetical protein